MIRVISLAFRQFFGFFYMLQTTKIAVMEVEKGDGNYDQEAHIYCLWLCGNQMFSHHRH